MNTAMAAEDELGQVKISRFLGPWQKQSALRLQKPEPTDEQPYHSRAA